MGGLEYFCRLPDGSETGWQAKYYWKMDASLTGSLDGSLDSALLRHPDLTRFIVCIPFGIPNPGGTVKPGALGTWETWKKKREDAARANGRSLTIDLWPSSELKARLVGGGPLALGRIVFWFNEQRLLPDCGSYVVSWRPSRRHLMIPCGDT